MGQRTEQGPGHHGMEAGVISGVLSGVLIKAPDDSDEAPAQDEPGAAKKAGTKKASAPAAKKGKKQKKGLPNFMRIEVGIEDDRDFRVVQKLIGPGGRHIQDIAESTGAKVWIIGKGSRSREDSDGPLRICVGSTSRSGFETAVSHINELVLQARVQHCEHLRRRETKVASYDPAMAAFGQQPARFAAQSPAARHGP